MLILPEIVSAAKKDQSSLEGGVRSTVVVERGAKL